MNIKYTSDAEDVIREGTQWLLERIKELEEENDNLRADVEVRNEDISSYTSEIHDLKKQIEDLESRLENIEHQ